MMLNQRGDIGTLNRQSIFRSPIVLTLIGGILGIALYSGLVGKDASGTSRSACDFALGRSIATLAETVSHYDASQPKDLVITSSKKLFQGLPREYERTYYAPCGKNCHPMIRALRQMGWQKVNSIEVARLVWTHVVDEELFKQLQPWQRYNHIPRDESQAEEQQSWWKQYAKKNKNRAYFMPETYILSDPQDRHDLHDRMKKSGKGKKQYWITDRTVEEELEMKYFPPGSSEFDEFLKKVLVKDQNDQAVDEKLAKEREWTVQRFICNPLVHKGMKIGVRSYFLVASMDPLVVLYMDGFARYGYTEEFMSKPTRDQYDSTFQELDEQVLRPYVKTKSRLKRAIKYPMNHLRMQSKDLVATLVDAFGKFFNGMEPTKAEDGFKYFAMDLTIDENLDVWLHETYKEAKLPEDYYFELEQMHSVFHGMGQVLTEIWEKQEDQKPILPLQNTGSWEVVAAGDWRFKYEGYTRKEQKKRCRVDPTSYKKFYKLAPNDLLPAEYEEKA